MPVYNLQHCYQWKCPIRKKMSGTVHLPTLYLCREAPSPSCLPPPNLPSPSSLPHPHLLRIIPRFVRSKGYGAEGARGYWCADRGDVGGVRDRHSKCAGGEAFGGD